MLGEVHAFEPAEWASYYGAAEQGAMMGIKENIASGLTFPAPGRS